MVKLEVYRQTDQQESPQPIRYQSRRHHIILYKILLAFVLVYSLQITIISSAEVPIEATPIIELTPREYAKQQVIEKWGESEWEYFDDLIHRESSWKSDAQNSRSTAFGYGQFLDSTWKTVGCVKTTDPNTQIDCTIKYVEARYGTPSKSILFHNANNYY